MYLTLPTFHALPSYMGIYMAVFLTKATGRQNKILRCTFSVKRFESASKGFSAFSICRFPFIHKYFTLLLIHQNLGHNAIFKLAENVSHTRSNNVNLICAILTTILFTNSVTSWTKTVVNSLPLDRQSSSYNW